MKTAGLLLLSLTLASFPVLSAFVQSAFLDDDDLVLAGRINSMLMPVQDSSMEMPAMMDNSSQATAMQFSMARDVTWLLRGDWIMAVAEDNRTTFDAEFIKVTTNGTMPHTHTITNFTAADGIAPPMVEGAGVAEVNGTADLYFNDALVWRQAAMAISITNGTILKIDIESQEIDDHFHGQPVYGTVDTMSRDGVVVTLPSPKAVEERIGNELEELRANATEAQESIERQTGQAANTFSQEVADVLGNITGSIRDFFSP